MKHALILLSGGLDSATVMALAYKEAWALHALSFDYGQRHRAELLAAKRIAQVFKVMSHTIVPLPLSQIGGSALTDSNIAVPTQLTFSIPLTYVPARNIIFLSYALAVAEVKKINDIFIGVNAVDYSGYPDCRPEFIAAFENMAKLGTQVGVEGQPVSIHAPLISLSKAEIIKLGHQLGVDYSMTVSCYQADAQGRACGVCDSCRLRQKGFEESGLSDTTVYAVTGEK